MSILQQIIQEAVDANPLGMKKSFEEAIRSRIAEAIEAKRQEMFGIVEQAEELDQDALAESVADTLAELIEEEELELTEEEIEAILEQTLNELSKKTLGSYVKGASADAQDSRWIQGAAHVRGKGHEGTEAKYADKADKREKGIERAVTKLTKEEVEPINEVSSKLLSRYVKKASGDIVNKTRTKDYGKAMGRVVGVATATDKLAKKASAQGK